MTIAPVIRRRIELRMGLRQLSSKSGILLGALEEAELRDSIEHFSVDQIRRLERAMNFKLFELLATDQPQASESLPFDLENLLSDEALRFLLEVTDIERETGWWAQVANEETPRDEVAELVEMGAMEIRAGRVFVNPTIAESLGLLNHESEILTRTALFSAEFSNVMGRTLARS